MPGGSGSLYIPHVRSSDQPEKRDSRFAEYPARAVDVETLSHAGHSGPSYDVVVMECQATWVAEITSHVCRTTFPVAHAILFLLSFFPGRRQSPHFADTYARERLLAIQPLLSFTFNLGGGCAEWMSRDGGGLRCGHEAASGVIMCVVEDT
jgi:hypothetical protein